MLLLGIDGASRKILDPMFASGRMKNLRSIAENGHFGPLRSDSVLLSPRVWTSIATGKPPIEHGIDGWVKVGTDAKAELFYSTDRRGAALWNILSDAGKTVAVVNWLVTYPPEVVNGVMVTDHALAREVRGKEHIGNMFAKARGAELQPVESASTGISAVYPEEWAQRALAPVHERTLTRITSPFLDSSPDHGFRSFGENLRDFWNVDQRLTSIALEILEEKDPDVLMVLLQGIDRVSHFLFGCVESPTLYPEYFRPTFEQRLNCQRAVYSYYEFTDELIGQLLRHYDDDDLVLVVSDHGFEAEFLEYRTGGHTTPAASYGVCLARGPGVRSGRRIHAATSILDIAPTILGWYGLPQGANMKGRPAEWLASFDDRPPPVLPYDDLVIERVGRGESGGETKLKKDLDSLGYLQ